MGTVWLARHLALDIDVALKFIDSSLTRQPDYVDRFRREARAAAQIKSPHVVGVLDYGTDVEGRPFMAMEYLEGVTAGEFLKVHGRLTPLTVARIVTHAARGLGKAHALGVVHRDIKPENLFLCGDSEEDSFVLKVLDFGVAKAGLSSNGQGTMAGQLIGSPAYMSPEQAHGHKFVDHRTDLFSLAVVAYQCLTGTRAFKGSGVGELLLSICSTTPAAPTKVVSDLPPEIDAWFEKALAKEADARFQSARELGATFCDALGLSSASGIDLTSSYSSLSQPGSGSYAARSTPLPEVVPDPQLAEEETRIIAPQSRAPGLMISQPPLAIQSGSIAEALTPLTSVPHALGVALLDQQGECLLMRGKEQNAMTFFAIASHARTVAETVESIESAAKPSQLSARFDKVAIYVRWIGPFTLVVHGGAQLRALLLTVGSNKLVARLEEFMDQPGAADQVAELLRESGRTSATISPEDVTSTSVPQARSAPDIPENLRRRKERLLVHRGQVVGGSRPNTDGAKKRVVLYRGKVVE